jgi:hypothetical protein
MRTLIMGAGTVIKEPLAMLVPVRQASFFRWCLRGGLRVLKPMTLMAIGMYQERMGAISLQSCTENTLDPFLECSNNLVEGLKQVAQPDGSIAWLSRIFPPVRAV